VDSPISPRETGEPTKSRLFLDEMFLNKTQAKNKESLRKLRFAKLWDAVEF